MCRRCIIPVKDAKQQTIISRVAMLNRVLKDIREAAPVGWRNGPRLIYCEDGSVSHQDRHVLVLAKITGDSPEAVAKKISEWAAWEGYELESALNICIVQASRGKQMPWEGGEWLT